jgi:predicted flap endonuclease-1-like 5' DNA nuclease
MGYLVTEIIGLLLGAAVLGLVIGWALFGLGKKNATTVSNPALEGELKAERDLRKKAETRLLELESREMNFSDHQKERENKIAELTRQLEEYSKQRAQTASEVDLRQQRISMLETELAHKQEEVKRLAADRQRPADLDERLVERDRLIARYKADLENALATAGKDTGRLTQLERENAELRAALAAPMPTSPAPSPQKELAEKEAQIARLNTELSNLKSAFDASEQALEEQDAAIDKLTRDLQGVQHRLAIAEGRETASMTRPRVPRPVTNPRFQAIGDSQESTVALTLDTLVGQVDQAPQGLPARRPGNTGVSPRPTPTGTNPRPITTEATRPVVTEPARTSPPTGTSRRPTGTTGIFPRAGGATTGTSARPVTNDPSGNESTLALSLETLVAQIDSKPVTPGPITRSTPRVAESTGMTALADMVAAIDAARPSLPQAPEGASDDLMRIDGISSTSATRLNALGLRTWRQIASLNDAQLALVAEILKVSVDKIKREQWLEQARTLAS